MQRYRRRRVEDLNLCGLSPTRFRSERHEPLGQPSRNYVCPLRIELRSTVPQTAILSVILWAQI
jgi:hypothetical protein